MSREPGSLPGFLLSASIGCSVERPIDRGALRCRAPLGHFSRPLAPYPGPAAVFTDVDRFRPAAAGRAPLRLPVLVAEARCVDRGFAAAGRARGLAAAPFELASSLSRRSRRVRLSSSSLSRSARSLRTSSPLSAPSRMRTMASLAERITRPSRSRTVTRSSSAERLRVLDLRQRRHRAQPHPQPGVIQQFDEPVVRGVLYLVAQLRQSAPASPSRRHAPGSTSRAASIRWRWAAPARPSAPPVR